MGEAHGYGFFQENVDKSYIIRIVIGWIYGLIFLPQNLQETYFNHYSISDIFCDFDET